MTSDDIPAAPDPLRFWPDQITLYGVMLNLESTEKMANLPFDGKFLRLAVIPIGSDDPLDTMVIAAIYGYAFEGQCYRYDKPKLLVFRPGVSYDNAKGCGFENLGYSMWQITKKTTIVELAVSIDLAEEIVLNSNLPGNRNPNTYGNSFLLAHRGGRLNRGGGGQS